MKTNNKPEGNHCGTKPKKFAFGIAPLGIISIGIVPMGVVSIGIVPMGIFSFGAVAMGIVNLSIVGMGIISSGITTMGLWEYSPNIGNNNHEHNNIEKKSSLYKSKEEALKMAKELNCTGVHKMGDYWMPCNMH